MVGGSEHEPRWPWLRVKGDPVGRFRWRNCVLAVMERVGPSGWGSDVRMLLLMVYEEVAWDGGEERLGGMECDGRREGEDAGILVAGGRCLCGRESSNVSSSLLHASVATIGTLRRRIGY